MSDDDFFEDDEPLDRIRARQAEPYDFVTAPPSVPRALTLTLWQPTGGHYVATTDGPAVADEGACR